MNREQYGVFIGFENSSAGCTVGTGGTCPFAAYMAAVFACEGVPEYICPLPHFLNASYFLEYRKNS